MAGPVVAGNPSAAPLDMNVRIRLSIMMFMQFAIWGSWATVIGNYLKEKGFSESQIGTIGAMMPLGGMIGPVLLILSQLADRFVPSQILMAVFHFVGAGCMYWVSTISSPDQYQMLFTAMLVYALLYNMTLALANSITFTHVDGERDFPGIRVFGTFGWIAAGLTLDYVLGSSTDPVFKRNTFLLLAAGLSVGLGVFSLLLPKTPPAGKPGDAFPFVQALRLFRDRSFAVFFVVSFIITIALAFYYTFTGLYLAESHGFKQIAATMSLGQFAEIGFLIALPFFLRTLGMKTVLLLGMFCWGLRYALFAISAGKPELSYLAVVGVLLHGICFDFFLAAAFIHVDKKAPKEIRASAQALFGFLTYGLGMFLGNIAGGALAAELKTVPVADGKFMVDWATFWWVPSIGVLVSMAIFAVAFREDEKKA